VRWRPVVVVVLGGLLIWASAQAGPCAVVAAPCIYEGLPFTVVAIDAETRAPIAGVHVLAEWVMWGRGGQDGPLMVQDSESGGDGRAQFPKWGPIRGYAAGLVRGNDPVISLFKPGYEVAVIENRFPPDRDPDDRVRRFNQDGETVALVPFRGTPQSWTHQLRMAEPQSAQLGEERLRQFRSPYLNRLRRVHTEYLLLPESVRQDAVSHRFVESKLRILEGSDR